MGIYMVGFSLRATVSVLGSMIRCEHISLPSPILFPPRHVSCTPRCYSLSTFNCFYVQQRSHINLQCAPNSSLCDILELIIRPVLSHQHNLANRFPPQCTHYTYDSLLYLCPESRSRGLNTGRSHHPSSAEFTCGPIAWNVASLCIFWMLALKE